MAKIMARVEAMIGEVEEAIAAADAPLTPLWRERDRLVREIETFGEVAPDPPVPPRPRR